MYAKGNVFIMSVCLSVQAITFEWLDIRTLFLVWSRCTNPLCAHAQNGRFRAMLKQGIKKFTQFLQFTLLCAHIIHEYGAHSDLLIFSDQVDQVLLPHFP